MDKIVPWIALGCILLFAGIVAYDYYENTRDALVLFKVHNDTILVDYTGDGKLETYKVSQSQYERIRLWHIVTIWDSNIFGQHIVGIQ